MCQKLDIENWAGFLNRLSSRQHASECVIGMCRDTVRTFKLPSA